MNRPPARQSIPMLWRFALLALAFAVLPRPARADVRQFEANARQDHVTVGDRFQFYLAIETDGNAPDSAPEPPDWGGLSVVEGPETTQQISVVNGHRSFLLYYSYILTAPQPGEYTIGSASITSNGRRFETKPLQITAAPQDMTALPESLRDEPILYPVTDDPDITRMLRGHVFIRPVISKSDPYVGEPITVAYYLYEERLPPIMSIRLAQPQADSMLADEPFVADMVTPTENKAIDGHEYDVTLLYRNTFTPTKPGKFSIEGFGIQFRLPYENRRQRRSPGLDSFFDLDPAFSPVVGVSAPAAPLNVNVKPLPEDGRPSGFSGTVGDFTLKTSIDHKVASEDDLITLTATIEGKGNPALAAAPAFPPENDFDVFDQTEKVEKRSGGGTPGGKKTIEYLLRPKRSGTLRIPGFDYSIFNPETEKFVALATPPVQVQIAPSRTKPVASAGSSSSSSSGELPEISGELEYIKPLLSLRKGEGRPLYGSAAYWSFQLAAGFLAGFGWLSSRRRSKLDPSQVRRRNAFGALDFKLKRMSELTGPHAAVESAAALERALREFVADWYDLKADGLTAPEISFRLMAEGLDKEKIRRVEDIMENCAQARYAPADETASSFSAWASEARSILGEGFRV